MAFTAKKEVTVCRFFRESISFFLSPSSKAWQRWGRRKGGRLQMVRFKNRYFVVEVIWDEAFEVC